MTSLMKIAIGAGITAAGIAITAHYVEKMEEKEQAKEEKKSAVVIKGFAENGCPIVEEVKPEEDESVLKKIKKFVKRKFIKALTFVALHMQQIEAIGAVLGLAGTVISISGAIRDFAKGNDTQKKLDSINNKLDQLQVQIAQDEIAINHNNQVFGTAANFVMQKLEVDGDALNIALDEIDKRYPV